MTSDRDEEEWTPSTEQVRSHYVFDQSDRWKPERGDSFDRWLARVKREAIATELERLAVKHSMIGRLTLRFRAAELREGK